MKVVIQRVNQASVTVAKQQISSIGPGLLILLGIHEDDTESDSIIMAEKIAKMRIMSDPTGKMNRSIIDTGGSMLVVSQFTLIADTRKGNRPSFVHAAPLERARPLYELFVAELKKNGVEDVQTGSFGTYMAVELVNDGPVTIVETV